MIVGGNYTIDFAKVSNIPKFAINVKVGDSKRKISLTLLENNTAINLNNYTVVVACKKSDGNDIFNDVSIVDAVNGKCEIEITEQMLALDTDLPCEIVLYGANGVVATSSNFVIGRLSSVRNEKNIVSSNEFSALTKALVDVKDVNSKIEVERKRIDLLTRIENGQTEGNAELLDIRVGEDGVSYGLAGEAIRSQMRYLKSVVLPQNYLNIPKRLTEISVSSKRMEATFDSLLITELQGSSGHSGFNIVINSDIKSINFDIEHKDFGVNCGLYYYKGNSLLGGYKVVARDISSSIVTENIEFILDWNEINEGFALKGADNLRFIVWSRENSKKDGYNYLYNISINKFMGLENVNEKIYELEDELDIRTTNLENELDTKITNKELMVSNIKNYSTVATTSDFIGWGSNSNMVYDDGVITFSHNRDGNTGFSTRKLNIFEKDVLIKVSANILNIDGMLSVHVGGNKVSDNSITYYTIKPINTLGEFEIVIDLKDLMDKRGELKLNSIFIVFSNGSSTLSLEINNIEISVGNNLKCDGNTLTEILNNIIDDANEANNNISFDNVRKQYTYHANLSNLKSWAGGSFVIEDNKLFFSHEKTTGNSGVVSPSFTSLTNFITVKGKVIEINKNGESGKMQVVIIGKSASNGNTLYITTNYITEVGEFKHIIDLNNFAVYKDLDLTSPIEVLFGSVDQTSIVVEDYVVFEDNMGSADLVGENLTETCINFNNSINQIKSELTVLSGNSNNNILISPNGDKYIIQVTNDGDLVSIPVIPNKTLFIGNSLLLGHGTFGMCATDSKNDYYYHVTEYIKQYKPNAIFEKLLGAPFEQTETQEGINDWINNNINSKSTDFDLVIVQLGDNVNNDIRNELFKTTCKQLLEAIRSHMPKARVCWAGQWYSSQQRQDIIIKACIETGSTFIDIVDLRNKENEGKIGDIITKDDGITSEVISTGVASHPGNLGMKAIADRIIEILFN